MREFVVRLMYCEMLGHDVSWGYIHAINMTQVLTSHCCSYSHECMLTRCCCVVCSNRNCWTSGSATLLWPRSCTATTNC